MFAYTNKMFIILNCYGSCKKNEKYQQTSKKMSRSKVIEHSFEELSQSLRVLLKANFNANQGRLLFVDRAEAVGNIETGLTGVLNSFHNLYDAIGKQLEKSPIDWYKSASLALILASRNARHHNATNRIRPLYTIIRKKRDF